MPTQRWKRRTLENTSMYPTVYDLQYIEQRGLEMRRQAAEYRLAQAYRVALVARPSLLARLRALLSRTQPTMPALASRGQSPA
jgi:hypothetical protein